MRMPRRHLSLTCLCATLALVSSTLGASAATTGHRAAGPTRGGTVTIAFSGNFTSLDPAQAVNDDWWAINGTLYNGLYQFDRHGQPQLDLAAQPPTINSDRKVWTFHIRPGVRFHNGIELTAADVKYSITRVLDPHLKPVVSWGQSTDDIFEGSHAFVLGKASGVSGIQVLGRYTIRFVLVQPLAVLPYILASSYNFILPRAVVSTESADALSSHPIGTGPFMLQSWSKGSNELVFVRNPRYFHAGKPYLDKIVMDINVAPSVIALRVERGELQGYGNSSEVNAADIRQAQADPKYAHYVVEASPTFASWLSLNGNVPPLTSRLLREAVAMAINRTKLVKLLGGNAIPAYQVYSPGMPQFDPALATRPVYPYDPHRAAALVKASGYHGQQITIWYQNNQTYDAAMAPGILQDVQQIGLNATLRGATDTTVRALGKKVRGLPVSFSAWGYDYPDASDIFSSNFTCAANVDGGGPRAHYCDPAADRLVSAGDALALGSARNALYQQAQKRILQAAPAVPLVYLKSIVLVSPHVGGFYYEPMFGWQFENYWLTH